MYRSININLVLTVCSTIITQLYSVCEKLDQKLKKMAAKPNETNNSTNNLASILANIGNQLKNMPQPKQDEIVNILGSLLQRIEKKVTFKVNFTDGELIGFYLFICVCSIDLINLINYYCLFIVNQNQVQIRTTLLAQFPAHILVWMQMIVLSSNQLFKPLL